MRRTWFPLLLLFSLAACVTIGGQSPETSYFLIPVQAEQPSGAGADHPAMLRLQIAPVTLAAFLDRPQIVARDDSRLVMADFARWGEPLQEGIARAVGANLEGLRPDFRTVTSFSGRTPDQPVLQLAVNRFDGRPGQPAVVAVRWRLLDRTRRLEGDFYREIEAHGGDYAGVVEALGSGLFELCRQLAAQLPTDGS